MRLPAVPANPGELFGAARSPYGAWVEHHGADPGTGESEKRLTRTKTRAGYTYAVGTSPGIQEMDLECEFAADAPQKQRLAQQVVEKAIADFGMDKNSTLAAIMDRDDATYIDAQIFVADSGLVILAHRSLPRAVGFDMLASGGRRCGPPDRSLAARRTDGGAPA